MAAATVLDQSDLSEELLRVGERVQVVEVDARLGRGVDGGKVEGARDAHNDGVLGGLLGEVALRLLAHEERGHLGGRLLVLGRGKIPTPGDVEQRARVCRVEVDELGGDVVALLGLQLVPVVVVDQPDADLSGVHGLEDRRVSRRSWAPAPAGP